MYEYNSPIQKQINHFRGRVAATQGAIVNLCDKPLDDKSAIVRLQGLCNWMVIYREQLNYWLAQEKAQNKPTVTDCVHVLRDCNVSYNDIYSCNFFPAIAQIEKYGTVDYILRQLTALGFEATGEQDYMDNIPYSLIQITKLPNKG